MKREPIPPEDARLPPHCDFPVLRKIQTQLSDDETQQHVNVVHQAMFDVR
jgi:hypothetical protein